MLDESLLDAPKPWPEPTAGLLRGAAEAGARVRTAARQPRRPASPTAPRRPPRAVLVAGPGPPPARRRPDHRPRGGAGPVTLLHPTGSLPLPARCAGHCPAGPAPSTCC